MLDSIATLFKELEKNEIIYCHWKSNEHLLPAINGDTDLDVLFLPEQRTNLEKVLSNCGLKRFRSVPTAQYNAIEDYIGFDKKEAKIWHLHTHYRMTFGETHLKGYTATPWGEYILENRVRGLNDIYTSDPSTELALLYIRMSMKLTFKDLFRKISYDDLTEIKWLEERTDYNSVSNSIYYLAGKASKDEFEKMIQTPIINRRQLFNFSFALKKELVYFTGYSSFSRFFVRGKRIFSWLVGGISKRLSLNISKPYSRVSPSGGTVIVFLGSDGAGKTTTINHIKKELQKKLDVKTIYFGSGDGSSSLLRMPMKIVAKKVGGKGLGDSIEKEYKTKKYVSLKAKIYTFAKFIWAITLAQEKKSKLKDLTKSRNSGMIVLCDRYPQTVVEGFSDGPLLYKYRNANGLLKYFANWEYKIYDSARINPPDLVIKLLVNPVIAQTRKPEMTIDELNKKIAAVKSVHISNEIMIDTSKDFSITVSEVLEAIWKII